MRFHVFLGPVWDRGLGKRDAYKRNTAPTPLLAFWRPHVETAAFSAIRGCATRGQREAFGGCILLFLLKRAAEAETNTP